MAGFIGVAFGFFTLIVAGIAAYWAAKAAKHTETGAQEARNSALEAKRSADAALAANAVDLRPYLFVDRIEAAEEPGEIKVCIFLKNYGKVPARSISARSHLYIAPDEEELRTTIAKMKATRIPVCAPGHERRLFDRVWLSSDTRDMIDTQDQTVILRVRWSYFGNGIRRYHDHADYICDGEALMKGIFYILSEEKRAYRAHMRRKMAELEEEEDSADWVPDDHATPPEEG